MLAFKTILINDVPSGLRQFLEAARPFKMTKNDFLFHVKSSFRSQDI